MVAIQNMPQRGKKYKKSTNSHVAAVFVALLFLHFVTSLYYNSEVLEAGYRRGRNHGCHIKVRHAYTLKQNLSQPSRYNIHIGYKVYF